MIFIIYFMISIEYLHADIIIYDFSLQVVTPTSNSGNMQYIYQSPEMQTQDYDVPPTHPNASSDNYDTPSRLNESSFDQVDYDTPPQQKFYQQK